MLLSNKVKRKHLLYPCPDQTFFALLTFSPRGTIGTLFSVTVITVSPYLGFKDADTVM